MMNPMKDDLWYDAEETQKYMGVLPGQVADLLALKATASTTSLALPASATKARKI